MGWLVVPVTSTGRTSSPLLLANAVLMRRLIDRVYAMLYDVAGTAGFEHVHVVDVRPVLSDDLANYKRSWGNELHPTEAGFKAVSAEFVRMIESV